MNKKITLTSAIALALAAIPLSSIAACPDKGQGGKLTYLGGDITIVEEVASAGHTSELGLYVSSPGMRVDLSSVTPAGTPFIMFNWNRNQTLLGRPYPYTVTFDPGDLGIAPGPIDLGIYVRNTGFTYYMGDGAANPDAIAHTLITDLNDGSFRVGFEDLFNGGDCDFNDNQFRFSGGISGEELNKVLTSGPDVDGDGAIDLVVTVGAPAPVTYDFTIVYTGDERVLIWDTVPAEWSTVTLNASTGLAIGRQLGNGPARRAATRVTWDVAEIGTLLVTAETRPSPGGNGKFAPTACGLLSLNDGAVAYKVDPFTGELILDETGQPIVVFGPTDGIHLIAVGDEDAGFLPADYPRDGTGDFDGDGLTDADEVLLIDSNPCFADTDGDGAPDPTDSAPRDPTIQ